MFHLLIATTNVGKIKEIKQLLKSNYLKIFSLDDFPEYKNINIEETGDTFFDNALLKARAFSRLTGLTTLADDSGLSVKILDNRPGVNSKRYGLNDQNRISKLLSELKDIKTVDRQAFFTCALVLYDPSSDKHYATEGIAEGIITEKTIGTRGFGYDPIFLSTELGITFGQASESQKNSVSHRGKALQQMTKIISKRCR